METSSRLFSLVCPRGHHIVVGKEKGSEYPFFCIDFMEKELLRVRIICPECKVIYVKELNCL